jgi:uncharacterized membrane-anchored protein
MEIEITESTRRYTSRYCNSTKIQIVDKVWKKAKGLRKLFTRKKLISRILYTRKRKRAIHKINTGFLKSYET